MDPEQGQGERAEPAGAEPAPSPEAELAQDAARPSWVRTALLRGVVAGVLGGLACAGYAWGVSNDAGASKQWLSLSGLFAGSLVFALAVFEHLGWGRTNTPGAARVLAVSALAGATTTVLSLAVQLQARYSVTLLHEGYAKAWSGAQERLLYTWDYPAAPSAALACFGAAGAFSCLGRGCGLRLVEQCMLTLVATLSLGGWVAAGSTVIPYGNRTLLFVMLGVAALLFPCASWIGDRLQRWRWGSAPGRRSRRRALAWGAVGVVLLAGPAVGWGGTAWKDHQGAEIEQLYKLQYQVRDARLYGRYQLMLEICETAKGVGLRGEDLRTTFEEFEPLARWFLEPADSPPHPTYSADHRLLLERGEHRSEIGDGQGALADCEATLRLAPSFQGYALRAWLRRGVDPEGAVNDYEVAFAKHGRWAEAREYWLRALFFRELGDYDAALADCDAGFRACDRSRLGGWVGAELAQLYVDLALRRGDLEQATLHLAEARHFMYRAFNQGRREVLGARFSRWEEPTDWDEVWGEVWRDYLLDLQRLVQAECPLPATASRSEVYSRLTSLR